MYNIFVQEFYYPYFCKALTLNKYIMIQNIAIKNFLSFKEKADFSFEATSENTLEDVYVFEPVKGVRLLKMIMFFGANASGKTNFIKAFDFLHDFVVRGDLSSFEPFEFDKSNSIGEFELVFYANEVKYIYSLKIDTHSVREEKLQYYPSQKPALIFERTYISKDKVNIEYGKRIDINNEDKDTINHSVEHDKSVLYAYSRNNFETQEVNSVVNWFNNKFMKPINTEDPISEDVDNLLKEDKKKLKHSVIRYMRQAGFSITDINYKTRLVPVDDVLFNTILDKFRLIEDGSTISKKIQGQLVMEKIEKEFVHEIKEGRKVRSVSMEYSQESKGTQRYFEILTLILNLIKVEGMLAIDELEYSLHPLILIHLISDYFRQAGESQLIFTTNNIALLNYKDRLRRDAIWILDRQEDGSTKHSSVVNASKFRKELSYFNYYMKGEFGGVPPIIKPFINLTNQ